MPLPLRHPFVLQMQHCTRVSKQFASSVPNLLTAGQSTQQTQVTCQHSQQLELSIGIMACRAEQRRHGGHTDVHQELVLQIKSPSPQQSDLKLSLTEVKTPSGHARSCELHRGCSDLIEAANSYFASPDNLFAV